MRRIAGLFVATALVVTGAASASAATPTSAPWRQTNGSASESRANPAESTLTAATVKRARLPGTVRPAAAAPNATSHMPPRRSSPARICSC